MTPSEETIQIKRAVLISWGILLTISVTVLFFSNYITWLGDDIVYQFNRRYRETLVPMHNLGDVMDSMNYHYMHVNGRYVAHWIVQIFDGLLGQKIFSVCNAIIYICFIRVVMWICGVKMTNWRGTLTVSLLVVLFLSLKMSPAFQMYIWMYLLVGIFLKLFVSYRSKKWWVTLLLGLFGIIAGNAHESINSGACFAIVIYIAVNFRKISLQQWVMAIGFAMGFAAIVFSPGTLHRANTEIMPAGLIEYRILALVNLLKSMPMMYVLLCVSIYEILIKKRDFKNIYKSNPLWWNIWAGCMLANTLMGFSGGRSVLGEEFAAIVVTVSILPDKRFSTFWLSASVLLTVMFLYCQWSLATRLNNIFESVKEQYIKHPKGYVYIDTDYSSPIPNDNRYIGYILIVNWSDKVNRHNLNTLNQYLKMKTGVDKELWMFPTVMRRYIEGNAYDTIPNLVKEYAPDKWIIVRSKEHPGKFKIHYTRELFFFSKEYEPQDYHIGATIWETDQWEAAVATRNEYMSLYPATYSLETSQNSVSGTESDTGVRP